MKLLNAELGRTHLMIRNAHVDNAALRRLVGPLIKGDAAAIINKATRPARVLYGYAYAACVPVRKELYFVYMRRLRP